MKKVYTGIESSGKSLQLSVEADRTLVRNARWFKKTGLPRTMAFNSPMSDDFIKQIEDTGVNYMLFKNLDEILFLEECDIFIDELIKFFPASGSASLSQEQLHFVTQGAKSGINIFAASQDFSQVHKQFRLLVNEAYVVTKLIGSPRPMKTAPPVNRIWGICVVRSVSPTSFKGDSATMESAGIPMPYFITRIDCERFDTSYKIPQSGLPERKLKKQVESFAGDEEVAAFKRLKYV
jgi:hypothetical protein